MKESMKSNKEIKENILKSLRIILKFYGLKLENNNIRIAEEFKEKHTFFSTLSIIYENNKEVIGETSFNYWNRAIE